MAARRKRKAGADGPAIARSSSSRCADGLARDSPAAAAPDVGFAGATDEGVPGRSVNVTLPRLGLRPSS